MDLIVEGAPQFGTDIEGKVWYRWNISIQYGDVDTKTHTNSVGPFLNRTEAEEHARKHQDKVVETIVDTSREMMDVASVEIENLDTGTKQTSH